MREVGYNRQAAVEYAEKWAFKRNPAYLNFDSLGGDCTNYASQCIFAGAKVMNPKRPLAGTTIPAATGPFLDGRPLPI